MARPRTAVFLARQCRDCGAPFVAAARVVERGGGIYCSLSCANRQPRQRPGPRIDREAVLAAWAERLPAKTIARRAGCSLQTVNGILHAARAKGDPRATLRRVPRQRPALAA